MGDDRGGENDFRALDVNQSLLNCAANGFLLLVYQM